MVNKRVKFYILFLIIPIVLPFGVMGLLALTTISIQPETQIRSFGTLPDAYAILELTVNSQEGGLQSTSLKYYLYYYVKVGSTHPASFTILQLGSNPRATSVPFSGLKHDEGVSYRFYGNGTWEEYGLWTYDGTMDVFVESTTPQFFPVDTYKSQMFYVWFNLTVYPSVNMESVVPQGFGLGLKNAHLENAESVWNQYPPYMRLRVGKPEVSPLAFQIVEQRTFSTFLLFYIYLWFPFAVIYYVALSANVVEAEPTQKIQMFVGLSITVIAFLWSTRQVVGTLTTAEIVIMSTLVIWMFIEARCQYYRKRAHKS